MEQRIAEVTHAIARELGIRGLINIQFVLHDGGLYIIEANPRASRTVPIIQKATGINLVAAATRSRAGRAAARNGVRRRPAAARSVRRRESAGLLVFEDARRRDDLGSGDEVDGRGAGDRRELSAARLRKGFLAAGVRLPGSGCAHSRFDRRREQGRIGRRTARLRRAGASAGRHAGHARAARRPPESRAERVNKIADGSPHVLDHYRLAQRSTWSSTTRRARREITDDYKIRRAAVEASIACLTSLDTARALAEALASRAGPPRSLQEYRSALSGEPGRRGGSPDARSSFSAANASTMAATSSFRPAEKGDRERRQS